MIKIANAPIAWTNDDLPELGKENTFEQCISEMALAGYTGTEVGNKYPKDPKVLNEYLSVRGLTVCNAWFSTMLLSEDYSQVEKDFIEHIEFIKACGAKVVGVSEQANSIQGQDVALFENKPVYTTDEWNTVCDGMNKLAKVAEEHEMKLCVHHHMGTGIQTYEEITYFMNNTNDNVGLLYDTGHLYYSDKNKDDLTKIIDDFYDRIFHVHLKDIREDETTKVVENKLSFLDGVKNGTFTVPGDGVIDFKPIMDKLLAKGYSEWFVVEAEQDPSIANPFVYAKKAKKYIDEIIGE